MVACFSAGPSPQEPADKTASPAIGRLLSYTPGKEDPAEGAPAEEAPPQGNTVDADPHPLQPAERGRAGGVQDSAASGKGASPSDMSNTAPLSLGALSDVTNKVPSLANPPLPRPPYAPTHPHPPRAQTTSNGTSLAFAEGSPCDMHLNSSRTSNKGLFSRFSYTISIQSEMFCSKSPGTGKSHEVHNTPPPAWVRM